MNELPDNVVQLDVLRIDRDRKKRCTCLNRGFVIDTKNKEVTCDGCGEKVDPFDAMVELANHHERLNQQHRAMVEQRKELKGYKPWLLVIRALEKHYGRSKYWPCCPSCHTAFDLAELDGVAWVNAELERKRRQREKTNQ